MRHADAEVVELAHDRRARPRAAASLLTVTRTSSEPAWASAATWSAVAVRVGGVGVGHRLDDDRMAAPDQDAADVDGRGLAAPGQMGQALDLDAVGEGRGSRRPAEAGDVEERDPDEEGHQEHEAER